MKALATVRYWFVRINWRVLFAGSVWLAATRVGLEPSVALTVREAAAAIVVLAFLDWANRNGSRKHEHPRHGTGVIGVRHEDLE